jgi:hemerythrin
VARAKDEKPMDGEETADGKAGGGASVHPLLKWSEAYSVGDALLDQDHRRLMEAINALTSAVDAGALDEGGIRARIRALVQSQEEHDGREEAILAALRFPGLTEHRHTHESLEGRLRTFAREPLDGAARDDLLDFLKDWFIQHVLVQDMHYKTYMLERRDRG